MNDLGVPPFQDTFTCISSGFPWQNVHVYQKVNFHVPWFSYGFPMGFRMVFPISLWVYQRPPSLLPSPSGDCQQPHHRPEADGRGQSLAGAPAQPIVTMENPQENPRKIHRKMGKSQEHYGKMEIYPLASTLGKSTVIFGHLQQLCQFTRGQKWMMWGLAHMLGHLHV